MFNEVPTASEQIAKQILENYDIKDSQNVQDILKQVFCPLFESMLKGEMENHLSYTEHERSVKNSQNAHNGYTPRR